MVDEEQGWSPYLAGALTGLLIVVTVLISGMYFGASTSFVRVVAMIENVVSPEHVASTEYFSRYKPGIEWQVMFVGGIFLGSLISSMTSRSFRWQAVPDMWDSRFGAGEVRRAGVAFTGGVISMFGARLAGGCPSGHGLSGTLQLSVSGLISVAFFFIGGILVARLLYLGGERQ